MAGLRDTTPGWRSSPTVAGALVVLAGVWRIADGDRVRAALEAVATPVLVSEFARRTQARSA